MLTYLQFFCYTKKVKIGNVTIKNNLILAPMAGVTDFAFRKLCKHFGAGATVTEMVSAKGLIYGEKEIKKNLEEKSAFKKNFLRKNMSFLNKTAQLLLNKEKKVNIVQIFGDDPKIMALACQHKLLQKFDIIDINMGCPATKIVKNNEGSKLMENFKLAEEIIKSCKQATNKPITVKFRKGFKQDVAIEFAKMCERAGADAITIHGRLASEGYSGKVDYNCIKAVKKSVKIPVIGSGDVVDFSSYAKMKETGVDAVMIGRGALGKPFIFKELKSGKIIKTANKLKYKCAIKHVKMMRKYFKDGYLNAYLTKHLLWYASGTQNKELKVKLAQSNSLDNSVKLLKKILL